MNFSKMCFALVCMMAIGFSQDVRYNFAADSNFKQLKTYKWGVSRAEEKLDQLTDNQLRAAIDLQMSKKGFTRLEGGAADMLLVYEPSTRTEKQVTVFNDNWAYGRGWGRRWYGPGMGTGISTAQTNTIKVGEVALDVYDTANKELVWRGVTSKTLDSNMKPDKWQKTLQNGAEKLLKNFPPPGKN